nr:unnamed protein product [Digitaria exilis]
MDLTSARLRPWEAAAGEEWGLASVDESVGSSKRMDMTLARRPAPDLGGEGRGLAALLLRREDGTGRRVPLRRGRCARRKNEHCSDGPRDRLLRCEDQGSRDWLRRRSPPAGSTREVDRQVVGGAVA